MMRDLQKRYLLQAPERIAYWDGGGWISSSEAIQNGAYLRSQIYINYPGAVEVWVNGSAHEDWTLRVGRDHWRLPPFGWLAVGPDFLEARRSVRDGVLIMFYPGTRSTMMAGGVRSC